MWLMRLDKMTPEKDEKRPKRRTSESVKLKSRIFRTPHHLSARFSVKSLIFHEIISIFAETIVSIMDYINEFHKAWIERTRQSIASWSKQPASSEEVRQQQERLNRQRAIREGKSKNWFHLPTQIICGLTCTISMSSSCKRSLGPPQCTLFNFLSLPLS